MERDCFQSSATAEQAFQQSAGKPDAVVTATALRQWPFRCGHFDAAIFDAAISTLYCVRIFIITWPSDDKTVAFAPAASRSSCRKASFDSTGLTPIDWKQAARIQALSPAFFRYVCK